MHIYIYPTYIQYTWLFAKNPVPRIGRRKTLCTLVHAIAGGPCASRGRRTLCANLVRQSLLRPCARPLCVSHAGALVAHEGSKEGNYR